MSRHNIIANKLTTVILSDNLLGVTYLHDLNQKPDSCRIYSRDGSSFRIDESCIKELHQDYLRKQLKSTSLQLEPERAIQLGYTPMIILLASTLLLVLGIICRSCATTTFKNQRIRFLFKIYEIVVEVASSPIDLTRADHRDDICESLQDRTSMTYHSTEDSVGEFDQNRQLSALQDRSQEGAVDEAQVIEYLKELHRQLRRGGYALYIDEGGVSIMEIDYFRRSERSSASPSASSQSEASVSSTSSYHDSYPIVDESKIIGRGKFGSVFEGIFEGVKRCAIKKVPERMPRVDQEIDILREFNLPNKIGYFMHKRVDKMIYIFMELAQTNLSSYMQSKQNLKDEYGWIQDMCRQVVAGVQDLHLRGVAHGDLIPENILIMPLEYPTASPVLKLGDFSYGCTAKNITHPELKSYLDRSKDWYAPEIFVRDSFQFEDFMKADVYSLGCLIGYILTGGRHKGVCELESHMSKSRSSIEKQFQEQSKRQPEEQSKDVDHNIALLLRFEDLMLAMIAQDPEDRPTVGCLSVHLALQSSARCAQFLADLSELLQKLKEAPRSPTANGKKLNFTHRVKKRFETSRPANQGANAVRTEKVKLVDEICADLRDYAVLICRGNDWFSVLPQEFKTFRCNGPPIAYNEKCPISLIRLFRNLFSHLYSISGHINEEPIFKSQDDLEVAFSRRFPFVLPIAYRIMQRYKEAAEMRQFYHGTENIKYKTGSDRPAETGIK